MRGATAPRLILELICGRILLPIGDASESGLLARIERLERVGNIATPASQIIEPSSNSLRSHTLLTQDSSKQPAAKAKAADVAEVVSAASSSANQTATPTKVESFDVAGLRRLWPDVIENVKKRRRLTWSLLSASAQILGVDDKNITIGIVNPGARDSFIRSESDEILRQAFIEVVGLDRKIEVTVDPSIDTTSTPEARAVRTSEAPTDKTQLSGAALLAAELGATVISETNHE
jgi:DNA polymerase-3 subunit gamma/tau